ncbi:S41 family peptidase [Flavobacteriaceae bacterium M23B6Z8]
MKRKHLYGIFYLSILVFFSCRNQNAPENKSLDGSWKSVGYGRILQIEGEQYKLFDETSISCLPVHHGHLSNFKDRLLFKNDTLFLKKGTGLYHFVRSDGLPSICADTMTEEQRKDPVHNFEVFAETLDDHFAYFKRNRIDWDSLYQVSKSKINSNTSDVDLYIVMKDIITTLKDNHGYIEAEEETKAAAEAQIQKTATNIVPSNLKEYGDFEISQIAATHFIDEDLTRGTGLMQWGKTADGGGYLMIKTMWLYADLKISDSIRKANGFIDAYVAAFSNMNEGAYIEKERQGAARILDTVMNDLKDTHYLIIDVRFNGGGQDVVSLEVLKRFNPKRKKVAFKKAVASEGFTPLIPIYLASSENPYLKPVYLLTSRQSGSATDFLALASLSMPNVIRIGSSTAGALSDALEKRLPNGWYFSVSNEIYTDISGNCYESIGIPPDYEMNYPEDRQTFFRQIANNPEADHKNVLEILEKINHK